MKRFRSIAILTAFLLVGTAAAQDDHTSEPALESEQRIHEFLLVGASPLVSIVVNDNGDATDATPGDMICETAAGNGICTLRAAVGEANALAGDDLITFANGISLIQVNGQIPISSNLTIDGPGPNALAIRNIAALSTTSRVFNITNFTVNLSGLTISFGNVTGNGGGIQNTGTLTIRNCVITDNDASAVGGGIRSTNNLIVLNSVIRNNASTASTSGGISFAGANLTVTRSTVTGNTSVGNGGGLNVSATASVTIHNSTISNNTAGASSGGIFTNRGAMTNTTVSGNTANGALATDGGGGVRIQAGVNTVTFASCTITGNNAPNSTAGARSGIWHETGTVTITNSIVAANVAQDIQRDGTAVLTNAGFNLIGENTSVTTEFPEGLPNGTSYVGTDAMPLSPMLGPLAYNGGSTFTHALLADSIAIDKGNTTFMVDQRNYFRPNDLPGTPNAPGGNGSDIGAFEFGSIPFFAVSVAGRVTDAGGRPIAGAFVILTDAGGSSRRALTSPFGYYRFELIAADESYTVTVHKKGYVFTPRGIVPGSNITDLDFMALP